MPTAFLSISESEKLAEEIEAFADINVTSLRGNNDLIRYMRRHFIAPLKESELGEKCYDIAHTCFNRIAGTGHHSPNTSKPKGILSGQDICDMCNDVNNRRPEPYDIETLTKIERLFLSTLENARSHLEKSAASNKSPQRF